MINLIGESGFRFVLGLDSACRNEVDRNDDRVTAGNLVSEMSGADVVAPSDVVVVVADRKPGSCKI